MCAHAHISLLVCMCFRLLLIIYSEVLLYIRIMSRRIHSSWLSVIKRFIHYPLHISLYLFVLLSPILCDIWVIGPRIVYAYGLSTCPCMFNGIQFCHDSIDCTRSFQEIKTYRTVDSVLIEVLPKLQWKCHWPFYRTTMWLNGIHNRYYEYVNAKGLSAENERRVVLFSKFCRLAIILNMYNDYELLNTCQPYSITFPNISDRSSEHNTFIWFTCLIRSIIHHLCWKKLKIRIL